MKLTAGVAYRVPSSRYAGSEPPSASLASSASLCATDTHYTALAPAPFQIPNPNPKSQDPMRIWDLELGIWGLGFGVWDFFMVSAVRWWGTPQGTRRYPSSRRERAGHRDSALHRSPPCSPSPRP